MDFPIKKKNQKNRRQILLCKISFLLEFSLKLLLVLIWIINAFHHKVIVFVYPYQI